MANIDGASVELCSIYPYIYAINTSRFYLRIHMFENVDVGLIISLPILL